MSLTSSNNVNNISNQNLERYEAFAAQSVDQTAKVRAGMVSGKLETEGNFLGRALQYFFGGGRNKTVKDFTAVVQQKYGDTISGDASFQQLQQQAIKGGLTPHLIKSMVSIAQGIQKTKELEVQKNKSDRGEDVFGIVTLASVPDRADIIREKRKAYEQELKSLSSDQSDRAAWCEKMIKLLDQASTYQKKINEVLLKPSADFSSKTAGHQQAERLIKLENFRKVNDRPNKLELLIEEIEKEKEQLTAYQKKLEEVGIKEAAAIPRDVKYYTLKISLTKLTAAVEHQSKLLEHQIASADYIRPPFEKMDEGMQKAKEEKKWKITAEKMLAQSQYFFAESTLVVRAPRGNYCNSLGVVFLQAAQEAKETNPNQEIMNHYIQSAELFEQAVNTFDEGKIDKASYLNNAANAFFDIAREKRQENPNTENINYYLRSAGVYQQAVKASDEGKVDQASLLDQAGEVLGKATEEAQAEKPNPKIIERCLRSVELYEQAVNAFDEGKSDKANYLNEAGKALFNAAQEEQTLVPDRQAINSYLLDAEIAEESAKHA